ncbi:MAG: CRISPR-associated ring nuclease, partial [Candidatus Promineifilaceae bacterium]
MANILIASLGNSPVVVTAMVQQLEQQANLHIDAVYLLYTNDSLADVGADFIEAALACPVHKRPLLLADVNSFANTMQFLNQANALLQECRQDDVYLSIAGGRKSMSVMLAMMAQFYPNVRKLYHLINQADTDFYTIEQLDEMSKERRTKKLTPTATSTWLIEIPFRCYSQADEIYQYLQATKDDTISSLE